MGKKKFKVLSIDGGGIRGLIPAMILQVIEAKVGPVCKTFDLIAGTSTGGIIALGLTRPREPGSGFPAHRAVDMTEMYLKEGNIIFPHDHKNPFWWVHDERYSHKGLVDILKEKFGEYRLKDTLTDVIITSYDTLKPWAYFFKTGKAKKDGARDDFYMWEVARATSAAPTFFEPMYLKSENGTERVLLDGGMHANNPAMCAYVEAKSTIHFSKDWDDDTEILMVSLGTGECLVSRTFERVKDLGALGWAMPLIGASAHGVSDTVHYQLFNLLPDSKGKRSYYRFQIKLKAGTGLDETDLETIDDLVELTKKFSRDNTNILEKLCEQLSE